MVEPGFESRYGLLSRLLSAPVQLRRRAGWAGAAVTLLNGASSEIDGGAFSILYALTWLLLPFLALAIGYGSAFFISNGREARGTMLAGIAGVVIALLACVILSSSALGGGSDGERLAAAIANGVLYAGLLLALAALTGLGLGRGVDYAGRRIGEVDDENW